VVADNPGYIELSGGLKMFFGQVEVAGNGGTTINFDPPFDVEVISAIAGSNEVTADGDNLSGCGIDTISLTSARVFNETAGQSKPISYTVIGK